jgi:hypothetical protein
LDDDRGFACQAIGYAMSPGQGTGARGSQVGLVALGLSATSVGVVFAVWKLAYWPLLRRTLISIDRVDYWRFDLRDEPYGSALVYFADPLGYEWLEGESSQDHVKWIFGVELDEIRQPSDPSLGE